MNRKKLIAGNWKMYKTTRDAISFAEDFQAAYTPGPHEVAICAPFTQLSALKTALAGSSVGLGAQNMHWADEGAYTGEISPAMLCEIGVDYVVIGHSERRQYFCETDETVNLKLKSAFEHGLKPIFCLGEVLQERDNGQQFDVVKAQLDGGLADITASQVSGLVIAYEPVWAIGTGRTATPQQAQEMCAYIRNVVADSFGADAAELLRVQYGGSVKPANAAELLTQDDIDGALVGGASLAVGDFISIISY